MLLLLNSSASVISLVFPTWRL